MNASEQLFEPATEAKVLVMEQPDRTTTALEKPMSKSARVREYLKRTPEVRNVDISKALEDHGVTSADVANVRAQQRKKDEKKKTKTKATVKTDSASASPQTATESKSNPEINATIQLHLLEAGVEFIRKAGGVNEALHILEIVRRIRSL